MTLKNMSIWQMLAIIPMLPIIVGFLLWCAVRRKNWMEEIQRMQENAMRRKPTGDI